ncbi:hypothetical protein ACET3Z_029258 [Daucus carota]
MDPAAYHPGPVNGYLLTLQDSHRSSFVWNSSEELPDLRVRTNFGEYWNVVHENRPPQAIMDAINDAGFEWVFKLGQDVLGVQETLGRHRGRPPVTPVEPEPGTYYTHVGSSSSDRGSWSHLVGTSSSPVGDVAGTSRTDGWGSWPESTVRPSTYAGDDYEGGPRGFTVRLEDDQDMSAEGQLQESYQFQDADAYRPNMSFLRDQYTTPPP